VEADGGKALPVAEQLPETEAETLQAIDHAERQRKECRRLLTEDAASDWKERFESWAERIAWVRKVDQLRLRYAKRLQILQIHLKELRRVAREQNLLLNHLDKQRAAEERRAKGDIQQLINLAKKPEWNLLRRVQRYLREQGLRDPEALALLEKINRLVPGTGAPVVVLVSQPAPAPLAAEVRRLRAEGVEMVEIAQRLQVTVVEVIRHLRHEFAGRKAPQGGSGGEVPDAGREGRAGEDGVAVPDEDGGGEVLRPLPALTGA
jgi:hypothetical protein